MATPIENLPATTDKALAPITRNETVNAVMAKVAELQQRGHLQFPRNYSVQNALMSAYLILQQTKNRDKQPVLQACTKESVANSLLDMVVQGLNPVKKQCYFIAYGTTLTCARGYFGTLAVVKRVTGAKEIFAEVVRKGDAFTFDIKHGKKNIIEHTQNLDSMGKEIVAAYCVIIQPDGDSYTEIMTMDQIKTAWAKSSNKPFDEKGNLKDDSTHAQFPEEMAKKTVINRACKTFINSSDDSSLDIVVETFNRSDEAIEEAGFADEVAQNANGEVIDVETTPANDEQAAGQADQPETKAGPPKAEQPKLDRKPNTTSRQPGF